MKNKRKRLDWSNYNSIEEIQEIKKIPREILIS